MMMLDTTDDIAAAVMAHAEDADALLTTLGQRLGAGYFTRGENVIVERADGGGATVRYGGVTFARDECGEPVAYRFRWNGEPEFAAVTPDGLSPWRAVDDLMAALASRN